MLGHFPYPLVQNPCSKPTRNQAWVSLHRLDRDKNPTLKDLTLTVKEADRGPDQAEQRTLGGHRTGCSVHPEWAKEAFRQG